MDNALEPHDNAAPADAATPRRAAPPPGGARRRTAVYCLVLGCLAAVLMFRGLGDDALSGDEAQYALVVQNIKRSGDWVNLSPYPPAPYLQKPPLYFWLTASTYDPLGRAEFAYRAWSAAAGVGAVVLTCVLGAMLFTPEVGALAGLLLMLNRSFLLVHGARSGTFDALLACLAVACAVVYWAAGRGRWSWAAWVGIGILAGLASLTKPFAGVPVVFLLAVHAIFVERRARPWRRLAGPALAVVALAAVAAPWFVDQWRRHPHFADEVVRRNLVQRVTQGLEDRTVKGWTFYPQEVSKTSPAFLLVIPAALYTLWACARGPRRPEHALVALTGVGWIALFSLSAGKTIHYAYPALPALAIILADAAVQLSHAVARRRLAPVARPRAAHVAVAAAAVAFAVAYVRMLYHTIPADRSPYVPWEMRQVLAPAIEAGHARVVFAGFPEYQIDWRTHLQIRARDCYYLEQMRSGALRPASRANLDRLLAERTPTFLVIARGRDAQALLDDPAFTSRLDRRFTYPHQGYLVAGVDLAPVVEPSLKAGGHSRYIQLEGESAPGTFRLAVTPPTQGNVQVTVKLRLGAGVPDGTLRYTLALTTPGGNRKRFEDHFAISADGWVELSALAEAALWEPTGVHHVTLTVKHVGPSAAEPVKSTLEEVRLTMLSHIPVDRDPRR